MKKVWKIFIPLLAVVAIFSACCSDSPFSADETKRSVLAVSSGGLSGTCVIVDGDGNGYYAFTCYHVLGDRDNIRVASEEKSYSADLLGFDLYHDVAVIFVPASDYEVTFLKVSSADVGAETYSIGNLGGEGVQVFEGGELLSKNALVFAADFDEDLMTSGSKTVSVFETTSECGEGMSGGALLDQTHALLGIIAYGRAEDDDKSGGYAVPYSTCKELLDKVTSGERGDLTGK